MLRLSEEDLKDGDIENYQDLLFEDLKSSPFSQTLLIIRSNFGLEFAIYIPDKF